MTWSLAEVQPNTPLSTIINVQTRLNEAKSAADCQHRLPLDSRSPMSDRLMKRLHVMVLLNSLKPLIGEVRGPVHGIRLGSRASSSAAICGAAICGA
jgi:hypothetical protein